jgi:hypothetical protein
MKVINMSHERGIADASHAGERRWFKLIESAASGVILKSTSSDMRWTIL